MFYPKVCIFDFWRKIIFSDFFRRKFFRRKIFIFKFSEKNSFKDLKIFLCKLQRKISKSLKDFRKMCWQKNFIEKIFVEKKSKCFLNLVFRVLRQISILETCVVCFFDNFSRFMREFEKRCTASVTIWGYLVSPLAAWTFKWVFDLSMNLLYTKGPKGQLYPEDSRRQRTAHPVPGPDVGAPGEELGDHVGVASLAGKDEGCERVLTGEPGRRCGFKILL